MCLTNNKVNKCILTRVSVILSNAKDLIEILHPLRCVQNDSIKKGNNFLTQK